MDVYVVEKFDKMFSEVHAALEKRDYSPEWANGTGYFDGLAKTVSDDRMPFAAVDPHGRKIVAVPHDRGTLVVFRRYSDENGPLIAHWPKVGYNVDDKHFETYFTSGLLLEEECQPARVALEALYYAR